MIVSPLVLGPGKFRVLLAALVVFSHLSFVEIGRPAVFAFFMLSGYWVLRMYQQKYAPSSPVWVFYLSRFMRVWLTFATAFVLVFLIFAIFATPKPANFLVGLPLLGIATSKRDVLGTSWSLDIELQFYLLLPLLSVLLVKISHSPGRIWGVVLGSAALTALGWYLQVRYELWTVLSYLPPFMIGALIWQLQAKPSGKAAVLSIVIFIAIGVFVATSPYLSPLLLRNVDGPFNEDWFGMAWVAGLTPLVIWNVQQKSSAFDLHLGNYSYALYITHWPVIALLRPTFHPLSMIDRGIIIAAISIVSVVFYIVIDRSWESLRRKTISAIIHRLG